MINSYLITDCIKGLKSLPDNSIQCIVTSPPYNKLGLRGGRQYAGQIVYDTYDDNMDEIEYQNWQCELLNEISRVLTPNGSLFYNHKDRRYCRQDYPPEEFILRSNMALYQTIIWDRGSTANQNAAYFRPNLEKLFWLIKPSHMTSQAPKFYRHRLPEDFKNSIWRIKPDRKNKHPAPFPAILAEICILATTDKGNSEDFLHLKELCLSGDVVLDPFAGSGTTLLAAANLERLFIGFDISKTYQSMAQGRLRAANSSISLWENKFHVEDILDHRMHHGCMEYLLKWHGYSKDQCTVCSNKINSFFGIRSIDFCVFSGNRNAIFTVRNYWRNIKIH